MNEKSNEFFWIKWLQLMALWVTLTVGKIYSSRHSLSLPLTNSVNAAFSLQFQRLGQAGLGSQLKCKSLPLKVGRLGVAAQVPVPTPKFYPWHFLAPRVARFVPGGTQYYWPGQINHCAKLCQCEPCKSLWKDHECYSVVEHLPFMSEGLVISSIMKK